LLSSALQLESFTSEILQLFTTLLLFPISSPTFLRSVQNILLWKSDDRPAALCSEFFLQEFFTMQTYEGGEVIQMLLEISLDFNTFQQAFKLVCVWKYSKFLVKGVLTDTVRKQNAYYTSSWQIIMEHSSESSAFQLSWMAGHYNNITFSLSSALVSFLLST
jgi:hypothetical protein